MTETKKPHFRKEALQHMNSKFCKLISVQPVTPGICLFWLSAPWKETSNLFLTGVNNKSQKSKFYNTEKSPKQLLLHVLIWLFWWLLQLLEYVKKAKVVPIQIWHTRFWVFMKSFVDPFFLMSSSNLVLSVVQKLRSPYFTTAMQKRNARKILKVRSPLQYCIC